MLTASAWRLMPIVLLGAALVACSSDEQSVDQFTGFDDAQAELRAVLDDLGYEDLGGDHPGPQSESILIGRAGREEFQVATGWEVGGPVGSFETSPEPTGSLNGIRRGDRAGAWATCGRFYLEVLDLEGDQSTAVALTQQILDAMCGR